jgi:hypothetical protein
MKENMNKSYGIILLLGGVIFIILSLSLLLSMRGSSIEQFDRFWFMQVFLQETEDWSIFRYLTGAPRITPLSNHAANQLASYSVLSSYSGNGTCYSVILHSYIFRAIFDHGIIGLICIIGFVYEILKMSNIDKKIIWVTLAIFLLNGLSVSSFNNIFFPISIIFLIGTKYDKKGMQLFGQTISNETIKTISIYNEQKRRTVF